MKINTFALSVAAIIMATGVAEARDQIRIVGIIDRIPFYDSGCRGLRQEDSVQDPAG